MTSRTPVRITIAASTGLATLLACLVLLPLLGHKPLAEWDEAIYAEVSREMVGGSWLVPHWNAHLWFEKPPLMLWITALFFKLFGVTEFWARAGSTFSGIAIVALLHGWLARTRDLLAGWLSTIILLATFGFLHICHVGEMDTLLSLGACLALVGLSEVQSENRSGWFLFWTGFAIALMTKGAASVTIPLTAFLVAILQRWRLRQFGTPFVLGFGVFVSAVLPWHWQMYTRFGHEFVAQYLGLHVITRATQQIEGHSTHWWFYGVVLVASAPPFFLLYPAAVYRGFRRPNLQPWALFSVVTVAFFTVIQTRLPHYIAPAYPALALLTAIYVADWLKAHPAQSTLVRPVLIAVAIWAVSIFATHSTLKSLHSADLAGPNRLDNREADALLRQADVEEAPTPGPLLYLRDGRVQSIATVVFYAKRPVQQITLTPSNTPRDIYMFDPKLLTDAVQFEPRLILLDKSLIPSLPKTLIYTPIRSSATEELGTLSR